MYCIWEVSITGDLIFCVARYFQLWDANERLQELLDAGAYQGRLVVVPPKGVI